MSTAYSRPSGNWTARLAWAALLIVVGAGLATWGLARWHRGAQLLGVAPPAVQQRVDFRAAPPVLAVPEQQAVADDTARIATLEARLAAVEHATRRAEGSAGRADALLVAFAARRAIERGVALGYLEPLLVDRFGATEQSAVATIITAGRTPQTSDALVADYEKLGPILRGPAPNESWWTGVRRELGSVISVHRSDKPNPLPQARYERALAQLRAGHAAEALAETMRLPGATRPEAEAWVNRARRQVAVTRALDELESAALLGAGSDDRSAIPAA